MANEFYYKGGPPVQAGGRDCKVMLATPMGKEACAAFNLAIASTTSLLTKVGVPFDIYIHQANCHVDDARNTIIRGFLESDCTDMMFLDADLGWEPQSILRLLAVPGDIVAGVYPHRAEGPDGEETYPFHPGEGVREADENGLFAMHKVPTGFMRIRREVLQALYDKEKARGRYWWWGREKDEGRLPVCRIVERAFLSEMHVQEKSKQAAGTNADYHSGDYVLCLKAKDAGFKSLADIEMNFEHVGEVGFKGNLGNHLRRQQKVDHPIFDKAVRAIAAGEFPPEAFRHVHQFYSHKMKHFSLPPELLEVCYRTARDAKGDILECGTGISTLLMGLALKGSDHVLYAIEHDLGWMRQTALWLERYGVKNVILIYAPIMPYGQGEPDTDWYGVEPEELPETFDVVVIDGPVRTIGNRGMVYEILGDKIKDASVWLVDDMQSEVEKQALEAHAGDRDVTFAQGYAGEAHLTAKHVMGIARKREAVAEAAE